MFMSVTVFNSKLKSCLKNRCSDEVLLKKLQKYGDNPMIFHICILEYYYELQFYPFREMDNSFYSFLHVKRWKDGRAPNTSYAEPRGA